MLGRAFGKLAVTMLIVLGSGTVVGAHKVSVFAHVHGADIVGEVMAEGEVPVSKARVTAYSPSGDKLAETVSDAQGRFRLTVSRRCDWRIVAEEGGHRATYTVAAEELPPSLPSDGDGTDSDDEQRAHAAAHGRSGTVLESNGGDSELHRQILALRRDVERLRHDLRWKDVVGGVGYILGMIGIAAYFLGARRCQRPPA